VAKVAQDIATAAEMVGIKRSGPIPLPTRHKKFALLKSPFKHKKSYEHFEIRTHRRLIWIEGPPDQVQKFINFTVDTMEPIASVKVREHNYHRLSSFYTPPTTIAQAMQEARQAALGTPASS
jgi:small subunit ribosomal protein S10